MSDERDAPMAVRSLRKKEVKEFFLDYLVPRLEDKEWLLRDDEELVKVRDETLFGFGAQRSDFSPGFYTWVFIRPLYWPPAHYAVGIGSRSGDWCHPQERLGGEWVELGSPSLAAQSAERLAPVINKRAGPWLAQFPDGKAVLQYEASSWWRHPSDPVFGLIRTGSGHGSDLLAYMWAWSGDGRKARASLQGAIADIRRQVAHVQREIYRGRRKRPATQQEIQEDQNYRATWDDTIAHLQQTINLLHRPEELRAFLQETANKNRAALKLDRARPVSELIARRRTRSAQAE